MASLQDASAVTNTTASTTWNFAGQPFSPRSVVSINGHTDDGLLKVRTDLQEAQRQNARMQTHYSQSETMTHHVSFSSRQGMFTP